MRYASLRQGLVGAWCPSLGPSGNTLIDRSGYGNHGTLTDMDAATDWVSGRFGWALDFDGSDDYVQRDIVSSAQAQTIMFFVKPSATIDSTSSPQCCVQVRRGGVNQAYNISLGSATGFLSNEYITLIAAESGYRVAVADGGVVPSDRFTHIALRWNGSAHEFYVDGRQRSTVVNDVPYVATINCLVLGVEADNAGVGNLIRFFSGQLEDIRVYSRGVTPQEIRLCASEPGIGLKPERTSVFFGARLFNAAWAKNSNQLISAGVI
jgi:hypothetical protein